MQHTFRFIGLGALPAAAATVAAATRGVAKLLFRPIFSFAFETAGPLSLDRCPLNFLISFSFHNELLTAT
jgi:hypothetical protein